MTENIASSRWLGSRPSSSMMCSNSSSVRPRAWWTAGLVGASFTGRNLAGHGPRRVPVSTPISDICLSKRNNSISNPQMSFGARLTGLVVVHPLGRHRLVASLAFAILRPTDFYCCADKAVKRHHRCRSRKSPPIQGGELLRAHHWSVRPFPANRENCDGHLAPTDPHNDFARIATDHDKGAVKLGFLTNGVGK